MGPFPYLTPMKHTYFKTIFVLLALTCAPSAFADGRNSSIPQNPPANPALPPRPPEQLIPAPPPEPTPVIQLPSKKPFVRVPEMSYPLAPEVSVNATPPPPPPPPPAVPSMCGNNDPRSMAGVWQGYVDWDCDSHALHPVRWMMNDFGQCCGPHVPNWVWGFDGPNFKLTDGRIDGAVYQAPYKGDGVLRGYVHYKGAAGCFMIARVQLLPGCKSSGAIPMPPPGMMPPPPGMVPTPVRPPQFNSPVRP